MTEAESTSAMKAVKDCYAKMTEHSSNAQADSFLDYFDDSSDFLSVSAEGRMSDYDGFRDACREYYNSLVEQKIITTREKIRVLDRDLVIVAWTGNIKATRKNGDTIRMDNYAVTNVFKIVGERWKVVYDHESALPAEIIKGT